MMNRLEKEQFLQSLKSDFSNAQATFLVEIKGLDVTQLQGLRNQIRNKGGKVKVAKITLVRRIVNELEIPELLPYLKEELAVVFAPQESPIIAKTLYDFSKEFEKFQVVAGCLDKKILNKAAVITLASLPSREVLLAQVCGTLQAPISQYVRVLNMLILKFLFVLNQIEKQRSTV